MSKLLREASIDVSGRTCKVRDLASQTGVFIDFYANFDRVLLAETSSWFRGRSRADLYRHVAATALKVQPRTWGSGQQYMLRHLLFGGTIAQILGFDRGPVTAIGGRATGAGMCGPVVRSAQEMVSAGGFCRAD